MGPLPVAVERGRPPAEDRPQADLASCRKLLTEARGRNAWLRDGSQVAQQQTLRTYATALDHSFKVKGRGRPKVKKLKTALPSLEYTTRGFRIKDGRLCLPGKVHRIPVVWSRELPSEPTSVRVYRDNLGHWYASFVVRRDRADTARRGPPAIGVDWGVKTTATTTDPASTCRTSGTASGAPPNVARLSARWPAVAGRRGRPRRRAT